MMRSPPGARAKTLSYSWLKASAAGSPTASSIWARARSARTAQHAGKRGVVIRLRHKRTMTMVFGDGRGRLARHENERHASLGQCIRHREHQLAAQVDIEQGGVDRPVVQGRQRRVDRLRHAGYFVARLFDAQTDRLAEDVVILDDQNGTAVLVYSVQNHAASCSTKAITALQYVNA